MHFFFQIYINNTNNISQKAKRTTNVANVFDHEDVQ